MATRKRGAAKGKPAKKSSAKKATPKKAAPKKAQATAKKAAATPAAKPAPKPKPRAQPESLRLRSGTPSYTVDDLARSLAFYRDALGFVVSDEWKEEGKVVGYMLRAGSVELGISQDDWAKGRDRVKGVGLRIYFETTQDVDALAARVKKMGHTLSEEVADSAWGSRGFSVSDPTGFKIGIYRKLAKK